MGPPFRYNTPSSMRRGSIVAAPILGLLEATMLSNIRAPFFEDALTLPGRILFLD